jgi:hypothetical protein
VKRGSSFHLSAPDDAAAITQFSILLEQGSPTVSVEIEGFSRSLIIERLERFDTAVCSIKPWRESRRDQTARRNGEALDVKGLQTVTLSLTRREYTHTFLVCSHPTEAAGLLGTDFLENSGDVIDFECGKMSLTDWKSAPGV